MAPRQKSKPCPATERQRRKEKLSRETPEEHAARLERQRIARLKAQAHETWEQREIRLARARYAAEVRNKLKAKRKHESELLRKEKALNLCTEEQKLALREKDRLEARIARCKATMKNIEEQLLGNRIRMIEANKKAKIIQERLKMKEVKKEQTKQCQVKKEVTENCEHNNNLQAFNLKKEYEGLVQLNNLPQNYPTSTSSYDYILQTYRNDLVGSTLNVKPVYVSVNKQMRIPLSFSARVIQTYPAVVQASNQSYVSVHQHGTGALGVFSGPIQPCFAPDATNIPSCSKLEIKCEVGDTDENILKSLPELGIVKKEPFDPSYSAKGEFPHINSHSAAGSESLSNGYGTRSVLFNNTESVATRSDLGEEMVISLDPENILPD